MTKTTLKSLYVISTDIIGYTQLPEHEKTQAVKDLESVIRKSSAIVSLNFKKIIYCPAGDSVIIVIDDNSPRLAYDAAVEIVQNIDAENERRKAEFHLKVRVALHHGPGNFVKNIAGRPDILGDCVDICTRVLSCVDHPQQILCSEAFYKQIEGDREAIKTLHKIGKYSVKHGLELTLYNVYAEGELGFGCRLTPQKNLLSEGSPAEPPGGDSSELSEEAETLFKAGNSFAHRAMWEEAFASYDRVVKMVPNNAAAWHNLGLSRMPLGRHEEALHYLEKARQLRPEWPEPLYNTAVIYEKLGEWDKVVEFYQKFLSIESHDAEAWQKLGDAYLKLKPNKIYDAANCFRRACKEDPKSTTAWYNLGKIYIDAGSLDDAICCLLKVVDIQPNHYEGWNELGCAYTSKGNKEEARKCFQRVVDLAPSYYEGLGNLGNTLLASGETDRAIECYKRTAEIHPRGFVNWVNLGSALAKKGNHTGAFEAYDKAVGINPDYSKVWYAMGNLYVEQGKYQDAQRCFKRTVECEPELAEGWHNLGKSYAELKEWKEALNCFSRALALKTSTQSLQEMGRAKAELNDLKGGKDFYIEASKRSPENTDIWISIAEICLKMSDLDGAVKAANKVISINESISEPWYILAHVELKRDKPEKAGEYFDKSVKINSNFAKGWEGLGKIKGLSGDFLGAKEAFQKAIELNPMLPIARYCLAQVLCLQGKEDAALQILQEMVNLGMKLPETWKNETAAFITLKHDPRFLKLFGTFSKE